jgi:hypothetical protein
MVVWFYFESVLCFLYYIRFIEGMCACSVFVLKPRIGRCQKTVHIFAVRYIELCYGVPLRG